MTTVLAVNPPPTRAEKISALKQSLDALYGTRATITTQVLAARAVRKLNMSPQAMVTFIYELTSEERLEIRMPPTQPGRLGFTWYRKDGTPNREPAG